MGLLARILQPLREALGFVRERPARMIGVGGALLAGSVAGIPVANDTFDYLWADYRFCNDCHVHDYANEAYERSVHFGLTTCHDCHLVPIRHYPKNLWVTVFSTPQTMEDIPQPEVHNVVCSRCHSEETDDDPLTGPMSPELRKEIVKIDDSPMHRLHMSSETRDPGPYRGGHGEDGEAPGEQGDGHTAAAEAHGEAEEGGGHGPTHGTAPSWDKGEITCMDCHGSESNRAHHFEASSANCVACHEGVAPEGSRIRELECRECHFSGFVGKREQG